MPSLDHLQQMMGSAVCGKAEPELLALVRDDGVPPAARLRIYRNHMIVTLTEALKATFPVVCRLVDERFFDYAVHEYIGQTLPARPCLFEYGAGFSDFLAGFPPCRDLLYLADVARLEWAINLALHADEARPLDRSALASGDLVIRLHPSLQLLVSQWPIERIWQANQPGSDPDTVIDLATGGARVQIYRRGDRIVIKAIEASSFAFLEAMAQGISIPEASRAAKQIASMFDLVAELHLLFEEGLLVQPAPVCACQS